MTDYRRIVSYLYKYERGRKGGNAGYVRMDIRQGKLKLFIHAQDTKCLRDKDFQVYFYYHKNGKLRGIHGGTMRFDQGESEFRKETREDSIFDTSFSFDKMGGILLYYNGELAYGTEWDNKPIVIGNFQIEDGKEEPENKNQEMKKEKIEDVREEKTEPKEFRWEEKLEKRQENKEIKKIQQPVEKQFPDAIFVENQLEQLNKQKEKNKQYMQNEIQESEQIVDDSVDLVTEQNIMDEEGEKYIERKNIANNVEQLDKREKIIDIPGLSLDSDTFFGLQAIYNGNYQEENRQYQETQVKTDLEYQKVEEKAREEVNLEEKSFQPLHSGMDRVEQLLNESPKLNHGNNRRILSMARIYPQDIGRLEIPHWHYGSNSFLIHGYYEYHYVAIGKLQEENGTVRSVLGVPGVYTNQEKYMAAQFGFKEFLPIKPAQTKTSSFGYWIATLD